MLVPSFDRPGFESIATIKRHRLFVDHIFVDVASNLQLIFSRTQSSLHARLCHRDGVDGFVVLQNSNFHIDVAVRFDSQRRLAGFQNKHDTCKERESRSNQFRDSRIAEATLAFGLYPRRIETLGEYRHGLRQWRRIGMLDVRETSFRQFRDFGSGLKTIFNTLGQEPHHQCVQPCGNVRITLSNRSRIVVCDPVNDAIAGIGSEWRVAGTHGVEQTAE